MSDTCIFCRIARGELPCRKVYEDDEVIAFHDIRPHAPVHFLIVPRQHVGSLYECDASHGAVLGRIMALAGTLAREQGLNDGFRAIVNTGRIGGQEVAHLHLHILGGPNPVGRMVAPQ